MINKIKNYFNGNKKNLGAKVLINNENWKRNYMKFLENIHDDTQSNIISSINDKIIVLKNHADVLLIENFSKNANERMKKLVEEDREIYLRVLKNFCDNTTIKIDSNTMVFEDMFKDFMTTLKHFTKDTERVYSQLKEYYPTNIASIMDTIKEIHAAYKTLEESTKKGIMGEFEDLRKETKEYFLGIEENKKYLDLIAFAKKDIEDTEKKLKVIEDKKETIKLLKDYNGIRESYEEREIIDAKIGKLKSEMCDTIFSLNDSLEEYKKKSDANKRLVQKYLDDPVSALLNDSNFEINNILGDLKFDLNLKDPSMKKKQQRIIASVDKIQKRSFLSGWITSYNNLLKARKVVDDKMKNNKIMMDLSELDYQISHLVDRINKKHALKKSFEEDLDAISLDSKRLVIEEKVKRLFQQSIIIE